MMRKNRTGSHGPHRVRPWSAALLLAGLSLGGQGVTYAFSLGDWLDRTNPVIERAPAPGPSQAQVAQGLREALAQGVKRAVAELGRDGGFLQNPKVRVPLPQGLESLGASLRKFGQGARVDAFENSLNHAAELGVREAVPVFSDAIGAMTLKDAREILAGSPTAATDYLRRTSGDRLRQRLLPLVAGSTDQVGVTAQYKKLAGSAGGVMGLFAGSKGKSGINEALDLDGYVTDKALDGLFYMIGQEEQRIRADPAARATALLKQVFAGRQ